jgi:hypothetical protein
VNQSAFIGAALLGGFALFLAARGRLTTYADVLFSPADKAALPPFPGIPIVSVGGPVNENKPGGGGGPPKSRFPMGLPFLGTGSAAANDNWMAQAFGDLAPYVEEAAVAAGL